MKNIFLLNRFSMFASFGPVRVALAVGLTALLFSLPAGAQDGIGKPAMGQNSALLDRIQNHYQHTASLSAKFTEELTRIGGTKRTRSGRLSYKKPGKMRWVFDSPQTETVVSDGHKLYDYQPDLNQVLEVPLEHAFKSAAPLAFLLGMGNLRRDFNVTLPARTPSEPLLRVILTPKGGGDRVEMGLNPSSYDLMSAKVTDALGNTTTIRFSDVRTNVQLADSLFHFEVPPGADVVAAPGAAPQRL
jgi:outer membrane lipoprotein carrier protein